MANNSGRKKINVNNRKRKMKSGGIIQRKASPVKIAYYVQRLFEQRLGTKEIIFIISSQFGNDDVREFANIYRNCFYRDEIRRIANLIYNIPKKDMDETMDTVLYDVLVKNEIPSEYIREHFLGQKRET